MQQSTPLESTLNRVDFAGLALTKTRNGYECSIYRDDGVWSDGIEKPTAAEAISEILIREMIVKPLSVLIAPPPY